MECSICLDDLDAEQSYTLNCTHTYHRDCITKWLHTTPNCPLCRSPVDADPQYVEDGIITEEQRLELEQLKQLLVLGFKGMEWMFPQHLDGFSAHLQNSLDNSDGQRFLITFNDYVNNNNFREHSLFQCAQLLQRVYNWFNP